MKSKTFSMSDTMTLKEVHELFISKKKIKEVIDKIYNNSERNKLLKDLGLGE